MQGPLKNTSVTNIVDGFNQTRSIFIVKVLAIEGDPTWLEYANQLLNTDYNKSKSQANRLIDKGTGRIIVRLPEKDNILIANPFLSRSVNIFPMVGEMVKLIAYDTVNNDLCYDYIGPIIPSLINTNNAVDTIGKRNLDINGNFSATEPVIDFQSNNINIKQIYPTTTDIAIQGRGSSQILIRKIDPDTTKPNEYIVIRSGMFTEIQTDKIPTYNEQEAFVKVTIEPDPKIGDDETDKKTKSTNFIQHIYKTKYDPNSNTTPPIGNEVKTRIDIVGQKINLFTYPNNKDEAYSIPYAELLYQYLYNLQTWLIEHKHGIDGTVAQAQAKKLGNNLNITDKGYIAIPGKGTKIALSKDIKIL